MDDDQAAATVMQKWLRAKKFMFRQLGPLLFTRFGGGPAPFGHVEFVGADDGSHCVRPYIVVGKATDAELLAKFVMRHWLANQTAKPEIIISVAGSAQDFNLSSRLQHIFAAGLVSWAKHGRALFVTAGTASGVNKLVAKTLHELEAAHELSAAPIIGVSTFECVAQRERLIDGFEPGRSHEVDYPTGIQNNAWGAALDPFHTHHICVESGWRRREADRSAPWGRDVGMRAALEHALCSQVHAHVVQLVLQGGPGTLDLVVRAAEEGTPVVALVDTGGAARALHRCVERGEDPLLVATETFGMAQATASGLAATLRRIHSLHVSSGSTILHFFSACEDLGRATDALSSIVVQAILARMLCAKEGAGAALTTALTLAVTMDRVDAAEPIFRLLGAMRSTSDNGEKCRRALQEGMQRALELHRTRFVRRLSELGGRAMAFGEVDMIQLYQHSQDATPFLSRFRLAGAIGKALAADKGVNARRPQPLPQPPQNVRTSFASPVSSSASLAKRITTKGGGGGPCGGGGSGGGCGGAGGGGSPSRVRRFSLALGRSADPLAAGTVSLAELAELPKQSERLARLADFFRSVSPQLAAVVCSPTAKRRVRSSDVFLWATLRCLHLVNTLARHSAPSHRRSTVPSPPTSRPLTAPITAPSPRPRQRLP